LGISLHWLLDFSDCLTRANPMSWPMSLMIAAVPLMALVPNIAVHLLLARLQPDRLPWHSIFLATLVALSFTIAVTIILSRGMAVADATALLVINIGTSVALAFCYFTFVNLNYTSLRVRMLRDLVEKGGYFSLDDLMQRYDADAVLDIRLHRLVKAAELRLDGSRYRLGVSRKFLLIGAFLDLVTKVLIPKNKLN
jgi:hypothetical protein